LLVRVELGSTTCTVSSELVDSWSFGLRCLGAIRRRRCRGLTRVQATDLGVKPGGADAEYAEIPEELLGAAVCAPAGAVEAEVKFALAPTALAYGCVVRSGVDALSASGGGIHGIVVHHPRLACWWRSLPFRG
jgi:hypothetical protein